MKFLIIESHPYEGSFNRQIAKNIRETLELKHEVDTIDLIKDNFNPVMESEDLKLFSQGLAHDELVNKYQEKINNADYIIFVYPIWWLNMPAILKGFFDKVFLKKFAYEYTDEGVKGLLNKKAAVISTMEVDFKIYDEVFKNPMQNQFIAGTLSYCGIQTEKYFLIDNINSETNEYRQDKMNEIIEYFRNI